MAVFLILGLFGGGAVLVWYMYVRDIPQTSPVEPVLEVNTTEETLSKENIYISYRDPELGLVFKYPDRWGKPDGAKKIVVSPAMVDPTEEQRQEVINTGLSWDEFYLWTNDRKAEYLIEKGLEKYVDSYYTLSFSNMPGLKLEAVERDQAFWERYDRYPVFRGDLEIDEAVCQRPELYNQLGIDNFRPEDCQVLETNLGPMVEVTGLYSGGDVQNIEGFKTYLFGLSEESPYGGVVIDYRLGDFSERNNEFLALEQIGAHFPESPAAEEVIKTNEPVIRGCFDNVIPGNFEWESFADRPIDQTFRDDFQSELNQTLYEKVLNLDEAGRELILRVADQNLKKFEGTTFWTTRGEQIIEEGPYWLFVDNFKLSPGQTFRGWEDLSQANEEIEGGITWTDLTYGICQVGFNQALEDLSAIAEDEKDPDLAGLRELVESASLKESNPGEVIN